MDSCNTLRSSFAHVMVIVMVLALPHFSLSIDMDSAKEGACIKINNTTELDSDWVFSVKTWYYPVLSRLELYRGATALLQKDPKDISENYVYYKGCITATMDSKSYICSGFGGKQIDLRMKSKAGLSEVDFLAVDSDEKWVSCYTTLTDNKSFFVAACCYDDNQRTWMVSSTEKTLPRETLEQIYDHAEKLGFKKEQFTGLRYNLC